MLIHAELLTKLKKLEDIPDIWVCFALIKSKNLSYLIEKGFRNRGKKNHSFDYKLF